MKPKAPRRLDAAALWDYSVKALASRAHSAGELREKLRRRAAVAEDVEGTLARLKDYGYLNDQRFAESFAAARLENQGFGRGRVLRDLRERRVAPVVAERTVQNLYSAVDEEQLLDDFIRRKFRAAPGLFQNEKELAAAYRRMRRAGFASGPSLRALKRFAADPGLLDGMEPAEEDEGEEP